MSLVGLDRPGRRGEAAGEADSPRSGSNSTAAKAKLANEKFVASAPPEVVQQQRDSLADIEKQIATMEENLRDLQIEPDAPHRSKPADCGRWAFAPPAHLRESNTSCRASNSASLHRRRPGLLPSSMTAEFCGADGSARRYGLSLSQPAFSAATRLAVAAFPRPPSAIGSNFTLAGSASRPTPCSAVNGPTRVRRSVCTNPPQPSFAPRSRAMERMYVPLPQSTSHIEVRPLVTGHANRVDAHRPVLRACTSLPLRTRSWARGRPPSAPKPRAESARWFRCRTRSAALDLLPRRWHRVRRFGHFAVGVVGGAGRAEPEARRVALAHRLHVVGEPRRRRRCTRRAHPSRAGRACRCGRSSSCRGNHRCTRFTTSREVIPPGLSMHEKTVHVLLPAGYAARSMHSDCHSESGTR